MCCLSAGSPEVHPRGEPSHFKDQLVDSEEDGFEFSTDETKPDFENVEAATFTPEATLRSPESTHRAA